MLRYTNAIVKHAYALLVIGHSGVQQMIPFPVLDQDVMEH